MHQNLASELLVIGVLIDGGAEFSPAFIRNIAMNTKSEKGLATVIDFDMSQTLREIGINETKTPYWSLQGSLTTPPCSEGVQWIVLQTPVRAANADLDAIKAIEKSNHRPVQPLNDRVITFMK